jgi:CMP-N-acetylneuraminic acid synthetase
VAEGLTVLTVAVIPCRMGSKRLPRKNALDIEPGVSLVQQAIDCAFAAGVFARIFVLTDDPGLRFRGAEYIGEPPELAGDDCDIATAVAKTVEGIERSIGRFDYVATLQPAVLARSGLIVRRLVEQVIDRGAGGGVTAARTLPWQWTVRDGQAVNAWHPGPYPRSSAAAHHLVEVNACQVACRAAVADGRRWGLPLILAELPRWAAGLDVDTPEDLAEARALWPFARPALETWAPPMHLAQAINGLAEPMPGVAAA